jgi:hypothetical protein
MLYMFVVLAPLHPARLVHLPSRHAVRVVVRVEEELEGPHSEEERDVEPSPPCLGSCVEDWRRKRGQHGRTTRYEEVRRSGEVWGGLGRSGMVWGGLRRSEARRDEETRR